MNIFIFPDIFDRLDNGSIVASVDLIEDSGLITSSFDSSIDPYDNLGLISVTSTPATGQITLDSNPPQTLNYYTNYTDSSSDYGTLITRVTEIESFGLIASAVDEIDPYGLIATPIYSYGTTSKSIKYGFDSILYLESPENFGLITENPYIQYGFLTDSVTYTDYGSVSDSLPANQYTDYGNNDLLASDEDYGLIANPYNETANYDFIFYNQTVYPFGSFTISGSARERFTPQTAVGSGSIAASGVKGEATTDSYNIDSSAIDTSIESSINYGLVSASVDETTEDYGLIIDAVTEVDSYGFLYPVITPYGLFNISGTALDKFESRFVGSGSIVESGVLIEKNTDRYSIDSILPGASPENYGTVNTSATESESFGLITARIDQTEDYHYIFYPAGETIYPYGTIQISGSSTNRIESQFTQIGSGSIAASGVGGEAITDFYGVDSSAINTSIESSINYGLITSTVDETSEDYGLIIASANEVDSYGFLQTLLTSFGAFNISGSARERFVPQTYIASGSIIESGFVGQKNTDRYNIDSILPGGAPEDYGTVNTSATTSDNFGLVTSSVDQVEDYHYIFYPAGETIYPYGTIQISGASFDELKIKFTCIGSGSISASGVKGEAITDSYNIDSSVIDTSIESSINYGLINASVNETEDYGLVIDAVTEVDSYGFLQTLLTSFGAFNITGTAGEAFVPQTYIASGSIVESGVLIEKNTDRYSIDSILPGGSPEDYGAVNTSATASESYELVTAPIDQTEDYHYIFYTAGETVYPYGTIQISGASFDELKIKFTCIGSGSIAASGVGGEAITDFYGVDSSAINTSIESSINYGLVSASVDETEDYGLITASVTEVDSYGFLQTLLTSFGAFNISGTAGERFVPTRYVASGSIVKSGILEEKNTDRYSSDSILPGGSPEDYGTVNTSATTSDNFGLVTARIDQVEDYHYVFYTAGETVYPYGTVTLSGASFDELKIKFTCIGSGSISASGVKGEAITDSYNIDSSAIDTSIESSINYGLIISTVDETTEDYGLITASVTEVDSYGFLQTLLTSFGAFNITGTAGESFKPSTYIASGSIVESGIVEEKNVDRYSIDSILPGGSPEDYGTVNTSATEFESYGLVTASVDQVEDYHYIFYPAGETIYPYGTATFSGASFDELKIKFTCIGSGSISASGVKGEATTKFYGVDSSAIDTSIESSINYGLITSTVDETTEDYGLIVSSVTEVDSYGFLQTLLTSFGAFNITGTAGERFVPTRYVGSGSIVESGILEEKNTDRYSIDSILPGDSPEDYGTVNTSATTSDNFGLITNPIDQVEDYHYIFYTAGETVYPYGTVTFSGESFNELKIQFTHIGSGSISASGVKGEAITDSYNIDSSAIDTSIESSINYGLISVSVDETSEDYGLIIDSATEVDSYGFLQTLLTSFGAFNISGSARERFVPTRYVGSGSIDNTGVIEEKNTDRYSIDSILPGSASEDYETVNTSATESESYGLVTASIDQVEDYHYIFYPAGETIYPYGTIQISGESFNELRIKFVQEGSGSISASGVGGEAITDFYGVDSSAIDTSIESSVNYGLISASVDETTEDYGLIIASATEVDSYGFLQTLLTSFGAFNISGTAVGRFKLGGYVGSGSIDNAGFIEEKNTDRYSIDSILLGSASEDYGTVNTSATESESYELVTASVDQVEDYHYIFYPAGETVYPYGTVQISGDATTELKIQFTQVGSGSISASGVKGEAITDSYNIDSVGIDTSIEFSTSYGLISASVDETEDYGLIIDAVTEVDSYGFLYSTITPYGLFTFTGGYSNLKNTNSNFGSGSAEFSGFIEEKNTDSYNLGSILPGGSPEDYGTVNTSATTSESYDLITTIRLDAAEDYHYIFYTAGETVYPFGTIQISGESFNELRIKFIQEGSGSISASGVGGEAITKFYSIDSIAVDTNIEFSTSYGLISASVDETEDYGLVIDAVTEVDSYGFLYPVITPYGLFNISGSAVDKFKSRFVGSGSIDNTGFIEEKNTDSYNLESILPGGSPEDYGTVNTSAVTSESYGLVTASVDQVEDYHYIFYPAGETVYPYGTIQISGESFNELKIQFTQVGSGSISASGIGGEAITDFYGVDSAAIDTSIESTINYGLISASVDETSEDYGLIIDAVTEVDSYGFLQTLLTSFGAFNISGTAGERFKPATVIGSGSIVESGVLEEKNTDSYNINSILPGGSPEDYGTVNTSAIESESYGLVTSSVDQVEDYHYIFYPAGETIYPYGTIQISGDAATELKIQFTQVGSGSISASGVGGEAITKFYSIDSIAIDTNIEFSTSYGLITSTVDETEDYGLIIDAVTEVDSYGFLYPVITPYGLFNISGSAGQRFKPSFIGSGSVQESGTIIEKNTDSYNLGSILPGGSPEDYGTVNTSATESESFGLITNPIDQVEDYHYIFYPAGETVYPYGTIQISGDAATELKIQFTQVGSGTINITGYVLIPQRYAGSGFFSAFGGGAEVNGDNPPDQTVPIVISGAASDLKNTYGNLGSGTAIFSGTAEQKYKPGTEIASGTIQVSGTAGEAFVPQTYTGSGSFSSFGGAAEVNGDNPPDQTVPIVISGAASNLKNTYGNAGSGTILISGDAGTEVRGKPLFVGSGTIQVSGAAGERFTPQTAVGSGTVEFSGTKIEKNTDSYNIDSIYNLSNNVDYDDLGILSDIVIYDDLGSVTTYLDPSLYEENGPTLLAPLYPYGTINISGGFSDPKNTYGNVGSGTIVISAGITTGRQIYVPSFPGSGTGVFSGTAREAFVPQTYTGSGFFSAFGGGAEVNGSNPPDQIVPIVISGAASNLKNTYSNVGSGTAVFSGTKIEKRISSNVGSGTGVFSGTAREAFVPQTYTASGTFSAFGGGAEVKGSNPPDQTVPIVISGGDNNPKRTFSNVGSGSFSSFGGAAEVNGDNPPDQTVAIVISGAASNLKNTYSNVGSGRFSALSGAAEVNGSNPPDQTLTITLSGTAGESFTPQTAVGSGTITESGTKIEKGTKSYVGFGTFAITGTITPNVQIYVPSFPGSGTLFGIGGAAEVKGSNPPDISVLLTFSGTAGEAFVPQTAVGSGTINISGVGVGISNPYRAPFVYVTII